MSVVISNRADAPGLSFAADAGIPARVILHKDYPTREQFEDALSSELKKNNVQLICLAGFMRILTDRLINEWQGRIINIHPSLLPDFKGLNAQQQALEAGVMEAGCTVHFVTSEMDSGEIILQRRVPVIPGDTVESLSKRILEVEHIAYVDAIKTLYGLEE